MFLGPEETVFVTDRWDICSYLGGKYAFFYYFLAVSCHNPLEMKGVILYLINLPNWVLFIGTVAREIILYNILAISMRQSRGFNVHRSNCLLLLNYWKKFSLLNYSLQRWSFLVHIILKCIFFILTRHFPYFTIDLNAYLFQTNYI